MENKLDYLIMFLKKHIKNDTCKYTFIKNVDKNIQRELSISTKLCSNKIEDIIEIYKLDKLFFDKYTFLLEDVYKTEIVNDNFHIEITLIREMVLTKKLDIEVIFYVENGFRYFINEFEIDFDKIKNEIYNIIEGYNSNISNIKTEINKLNDDMLRYESRLDEFKQYIDIPLEFL